MGGWHEGPLAGFDTETTGTDTETARIVTAAVIVHGPGPVDARWLVNPGIEIPAEATAVHGISTETAQAQGLDPADALAEIAAHLEMVIGKGVPLVIYNAPYDLTVMDRETRRNGLEPFGDVLTRYDGLIVDPFVLDKHLDPYRKGKRTLTAAGALQGHAWRRPRGPLRRPRRDARRVEDRRAEPAHRRDGTGRASRPSGEGESRAGRRLPGLPPQAGEGGDHRRLMAVQAIRGSGLDAIARLCSARGQQIGRIRLGQLVRAHRNGKMRPVKLDTFRFTTPSKGRRQRRRRGCTAATSATGSAAEFEVITASPRSASWSRPAIRSYPSGTRCGPRAAASGGATRSASRSATARACARTPRTPTNEDEVARGGAEARRHGEGRTRRRRASSSPAISLMIPDLPGLGVFRLDSGVLLRGQRDRRRRESSCRPRGTRGCCCPRCCGSTSGSGSRTGETTDYPVPVLEVLATLPADRLGRA